MKSVAKKLLVVSLIILAGNPAFAEISKTRLNLRGGLATVTGDFGGLFLGGVDFQVDASSRTRLGIDTGILIGSGTSLPILVSIIFPFGERSRRATPYLGVAVGPSISLSDTGLVGSTTRLAILLRPGMAFQVGDAIDLTVEMPMGGFTGLFYIGPMVGATVHF